MEVLGLHPGMCGGTSYGQTSNSSIAWTKRNVFKINYDENQRKQNSGFGLFF